MNNKKLLIAISKNLNNALININNLSDNVINKYTWYNDIQWIIKDIDEAIKYEETIK